MFASGYAAQILVSHARSRVVKGLITPSTLLQWTVEHLAAARITILCLKQIDAVMVIYA
jgi:hypothetical protein